MDPAVCSKQKVCGVFSSAGLDSRENKYIAQGRQKELRGARRGCYFVVVTRACGKELFKHMKKKIILTYLLLASSFLSIGVSPAYCMRAVFFHRLANFAGIVPSLWSRVAVDEEHTEVYALDQQESSIQIFNENGMEIFVVGENVQLGGATDIDVGDDGDIYVVYPSGVEHKILRLDYKGELLNALDLKNLPADFQSIAPSFVQYRDGKLYLADPISMDVVVIDTEGLFQKGYHLKAELWKLSKEFKGASEEENFDTPEKFESVEMFGFFVDREENIFFTVPVLFSVFKLQVDGAIKFFGKAGGAPGKFNVIAGITTDRKGNIYIADRLKSVVMIFDSSFNFQTEFGFRGVQDSSLVVPDDVAIDNEKGLLYVGQAANRGVSVFRIIEE